MPRRPIYRTAAGQGRHWSRQDEGLFTECGAVIDRPAGRNDVFNCLQCDRVVRARATKRRADANRKRTRQRTRAASQ